MVVMNDNFALRDQVALITGGARRVGAEIARTLHAAGVNILIHYRSSAAAAIALAGEFNQRARIPRQSLPRIFWTPTRRIN